MTNVVVTDSIQSIHTSLDEIIQIVNELAEETIRWNPTEEEWSIMQILSHLVEALPYWLNEIKQIIEAPGKEWGRGLTDPARLAAVSNTEQLIVSNVLKDLEAVKSQVEEVLSSLTEEQLAIESPSRNPRFGTKPLSFIVDHLLVEHAAKHCGQIKRNLSKLS